MKIYMSNSCGEMPLKNALEIMTDDWIEGGNTCDQTFIDLRDAAKQLLEDKNVLEVSLKALMESIPEETLHLIPDGVKFACLVSLPEYEELTKERKGKHGLSDTI